VDVQPAPRMRREVGGGVEEERGGGEGIVGWGGEVGKGWDGEGGGSTRGSFKREEYCWCEFLVLGLDLGRSGDFDSFAGEGFNESCFYCVCPLSS